VWRRDYAAVMPTLSTNPASIPATDVPDLSKATRDQLAAVTEIVTESYVDGCGEDARTVKRVRIKLADKRAALVDITRQ
jgi:hypothetical protein